MASLDVVDMDGPSGRDLPEDGLDFGLVRSYLASLLPAGKSFYSRKDFNFHTP
jgi:hypothetical protein